MQTILLHTPTWVWALLAALLALGTWQSRPRRLAPWQLFMLPGVLLAVALAGQAATFVAMPLALPAWAKGLLVGMAFGRRFAPRRGVRWDGAWLHLPASAWPLLVIVAIFGLRYASGVALALHPAWAHAPAVMLPLAALGGTFGGLVWGRAFALHALTRPAAATITGDEHLRTA